MAKRRASTKGPTKSDAIREILRLQPKATMKEIKDGLQERGVKTSDALINKIKYHPKRSKAGAKKPRASRNGSAEGSKADAIRGMLNELGAKTRPRQIIAALAARGIAVSSAQVSTLRKKQSRHRKASPVHSTHSAVSLEHLRAAKILAERLGGIDIALQAIAGLAKLMAD